MDVGYGNNESTAWISGDRLGCLWGVADFPSRTSQLFLSRRSPEHRNGGGIESAPDGPGDSGLRSEESAGTSDYFDARTGDGTAHRKSGSAGGLRSGGLHGTGDHSGISVHPPFHSFERK